MQTNRFFAALCFFLLGFATLAHAGYDGNVGIYDAANISPAGADKVFFGAAGGPVGGGPSPGGLGNYYGDVEQHSYNGNTY